ncbi:adenylate/guanylate cyclase domain-containing protein [Mesorhizobium sp.]|uniref:adenylate/guanylate cyclase domain-containing protein n=1 Tax=Mesorhizobium sp. TaxID=1871066 RepID=UPI0025801878|nr:adenylate/guanylate cyclase domain-containing protein [Mesorhizobium sp.]
MERDEEGTFVRLKSHRTELFEPEIKKRHGRVFKLMGDGLLAEFASVVDAVECAVTVQQEMAKRNAGVMQDERIVLRIGVHLGDVIVEGKGSPRRRGQHRQPPSKPRRAGWHSHIGYRL